MGFGGFNCCCGSCGGIASRLWGNDLDSGAWTAITSNTTTGYSITRTATTVLLEQYNNGSGNMTFSEWSMHRAISFDWQRYRGFELTFDYDIAAFASNPMTRTAFTLAAFSGIAVYTNYSAGIGTGAILIGGMYANYRWRYSTSGTIDQRRVTNGGFNTANSLPLSGGVVDRAYFDTAQATGIQSDMNYYIDTNSSNNLLQPIATTAIDSCDLGLQVFLGCGEAEWNDFTPRPGLINPYSIEISNFRLVPFN